MLIAQGFDPIFKGIGDAADAFAGAFALLFALAALAAFVAPVIFFLNFRYCLLIIPREDKAFYPSTFARWFTWTSLVVFTGLTLILIYWTLWTPIVGG